MKPAIAAEPSDIKGVILAAGYGTRFLPATKTVPKEMLPLVDVPSIQFIVDEFIASGIRDILIITSRRKKALEDYFDREVELETTFRQSRAEGKLARIEPPSRQRLLHPAGADARHRPRPDARAGGSRRIRPSWWRTPTTS